MSQILTRVAARLNVAEVSKQRLRVRDAYGIEIDEDQDNAQIVAVTVCTDQMSHHAG